MLVIRKLQIKSTLKYNYLPTKMAKNLKQNKTIYRLFNVWSNKNTLTQLVQPFWKTIRHYLLKQTSVHPMPQ